MWRITIIIIYWVFICTPGTLQTSRVVTWGPSTNHWHSFFFAVLGLELRAYTLSHCTSTFFCVRYFRDRVSLTICPGWHRTASSVARITAVSHWHPASCSFFETGSHCVALADFELFFWYWDLNSGPTPWATPPTLFHVGYFWDRVSRTICQGDFELPSPWSLRSAFCVARIKGVSHWCPACPWTFNSSASTFSVVGLHPARLVLF
jgi:hypothetical protein